MIVFTTAGGWDFGRMSMSSPRVVLNKESKARTAEEVSETMRRVHSRDTQPEMVLLRALRKAGFRFKTRDTPL
jgi:G:T-mismatch repair DNA endonuclease (very short patch repair protein)